MLASNQNAKAFAEATKSQTSSTETRDWCTIDSTWEFVAATTRGKPQLGLELRKRSTIDGNNSDSAE